MKFGKKAVGGSKTSTFMVGESYQAYEHKVDELINHEAKFEADTSK